MRTESGFGVSQWSESNLVVTGATPAQMIPPASLVAITVLSNDGIYATVTAPAHGLFDGESAAVTRASDANWNGYFVMKVVDANTLLYTMAGVPANTTLGTAAVASFKVQQAIVIGDAGNTQNVGIGPNSSANLYPVGAGAFFTIPAIMGSQTQAKKIDLAQWYTLAVSGSQTLRIMWILFMVGFFFCGSALAQPSGVIQLKAGSGITLTPSGGVGVVTVTSTGGGGGGTNFVPTTNGVATGLTVTNLAVVSADAVTQTPLSIIGSTNDFYQLFIQNTHGGTNASSDFVAANDQGGASSSSNYVDLGINSSTFLGAWGVASDGYIYTSTGSSNFIVGVGQTNGTLHLRVGGSAAGQDVMTASSNLITFIKPVTSTNTITASSLTGGGVGITNVIYNRVKVGGSFGTGAIASGHTQYSLVGTLNGTTLGRVELNTVTPGIYTNLGFHMFVGTTMPSTTNIVVNVLSNDVASAITVTLTGVNGATSFDGIDTTHSFYLAGGTNKIILDLNASSSVGGTPMIIFSLDKLETAQ